MIVSISVLLAATANQKIFGVQVFLDGLLVSES